MTTTATKQLMTTEQLLGHWPGHRNLTRRVIETFPEKELFKFSVGGMRPFAKMATELISIGEPALKEITENNREAYSEEKFNPTTKEEILKKWDEETEVINRYFHMISEELFLETFNLLGKYEVPLYQNILHL